MGSDAFHNDILFVAKGVVGRASMRLAFREKSYAAAEFQMH